MHDRHRNGAKPTAVLNGPATAFARDINRFLVAVHPGFARLGWQHSLWASWVYSPVHWGAKSLDSVRRGRIHRIAVAVAVLIGRGVARTVSNFARLSIRFYRLFVVVIALAFLVADLWDPEAGRPSIVC